jgi:hypothetical protein
MKTLTLAVICILNPVCLERVAGATLLLDSFNEGSYNLSYSGQLNATSTISSPLGSRRDARLNNRDAIAGAVVTSTLDDTLGTLSFSVNGLSSNTLRPLDLRMSYSQGGPFSILGYSAFELDFSSVTGAGFLIIELGSETAIYGPSAYRISINNPGTVSVPFSNLNFGTNGSINSFNALHFTFEAATEQFSMSLNEIRVVPEPSSFLLFLVGVVGTTLHRRRRK